MKHLFILLLIGLLVNSSAHATDYTFTGTGNWSDANLWDVYPGTMISDMDNVIISAGSVCTAEDMPADDYDSEGNIRVEGHLIMEDGFMFDSLQVLGTFDIAPNILGYCFSYWNTVEGGTINAYSGAQLMELRLIYGGTANLYGAVDYSFDFVFFEFSDGTLNINSSGTVIMSALWLNSNNDLFIDTGATVVFSPDIYMIEGRLRNDGNIIGQSSDFTTNNGGKIVNNGHMEGLSIYHNTLDTLINNGTIVNDAIMAVIELGNGTYFNVTYGLKFV